MDKHTKSPSNWFVWFYLVLIGTLLIGANTIKAETQYKPVDVALVLALDVSGSVSDDNWKLQRQGIVDVLLSERFEKVRKINFIGRQAIGIMQWGTMAHETIPITLIDSRADLVDLAIRVANMERAEYGGTCMGPMFKKAGEMLHEWGFYATRRIVDVSGDGSSNCGVEPLPHRQILLDNDITINGLPIVNNLEPKLDDYYAEHVMGGPGAFLVVAEGEKDFARAFMRKFISEIALK